MNGVWGRVVREKRVRDGECMRKKKFGVLGKIEMD